MLEFIRVRFDTLKATESKVLGDNKYERTANKIKYANW